MKGVCLQCKNEKEDIHEEGVLKGVCEFCSRSNDMNPSIVAGLFCRPHVFDKFIEHVDGKFGMSVREVRFVDVGIPLDDNYDKAVNHLKHFSMPILKRIFDANFPMRGMILKQIEKRGWKYMDYKNGDWKLDNKHPLLYAGFTPLFVDVKYSRDETYTKEQQEKCDKLTRFESEGYQPVIVGVSEPDEIKEEYEGVDSP